jgi:capsule polysaccharide export protein KpsE/RkpR
MKSISANLDKKKPMMRLSVETISPILAHDIAYEVILKTNDMINSMNIVKASEKKVFLKKRISEIYSEIKVLQEKTKDFYKKNGIYELATQAQKTVGTAADLLSRIIELKTKLKIQKESIGVENPEYIANKMMLNEIQKQYDAIMKSSKSKNETLLLPIKSIPDITFQNMELTRELEGQASLLKMMKQQYEMAKIEEKKESMFLRILDPPTVPVSKSKPKRSLIMIVAAITGFIMGVFLIFVMNFIGDLKKNPKKDLGYGI